jgi:N-hydroxyarylamine O-acetyltransferase
MDDGGREPGPGEGLSSYLDRIGLEERPPVTVDGLATLMQAHLMTVPFENLDVYWQVPVATSAEHSVSKIVDRGRGGWCFELNGAFAHLLTALGYDVRLLGAAVLLGGPNDVVDHLTLEVVVEGRPHLVDVGFGDGFARPLPLNGKPDESLNGTTGIFGFLPSAQGTTLVRYGADDRQPQPQYRFRRVSLTLGDLRPASDTLFGNRESTFRQGPVATRLIAAEGVGGFDRVTLTTDRLRFVRSGGFEDHAVEPFSTSWFDLLEKWFGINRRLYRPTPDPDVGLRPPSGPNWSGDLRPVQPPGGGCYRHRSDHRWNDQSGGHGSLGQRQLDLGEASQHRVGIGVQ